MAIKSGSVNVSLLPPDKATPEKLRRSYMQTPSTPSQINTYRMTSDEIQHWERNGYFVREKRLFTWRK